LLGAPLLGLFASIGSQLDDGRFMKKITSTTVFEQAAGVSVNGINVILEEHVLRTKESPYAKRWWSKDLILLQQGYTTRRNRVTTLRRRGDSTTQAPEIAHLARKGYLDEIDKQKKQHCKEFFDDPNNICKAASYAKSSEAPMDVPDLVANDQRYETDEAKAGVFMTTFFPTPPVPEGRDLERPSRNRDKPAIEWPRLTKHEVKRAIFKSNPDQASGPDEISFRV
jgi:hypothetical protein